jgi:hypothetical protein
MKGISLISGVLFTAFLIAATTIVYWTGAPLIQKMQCAATLDKMKTTFAKFDETIQTVSSEGEGSKRTVNININEGEIYITAENDTIYWSHECNADIISPRTFQTFGNVIIGANLDTEARESNCQGEDAFVLENEHLIACFKSIGSPDNKTRYNMSEVLTFMYNKDSEESMPLKYLEITLDNNQSSSVGYGYTSLSGEGNHLPYGEVTAYMESDYGVIYRIKFMLESGEDFLIIRGE